MCYENMCYNDVCYKDMCYKYVIMLPRHDVAAAKQTAALNCYNLFDPLPASSFPGENSPRSWTQRLLSDFLLQADML